MWNRKWSIWVFYWELIRFKRVELRRLFFFMSGWWFLIRLKILFLFMIGIFVFCNVMLFMWNVLGNLWKIFLVSFIGRFFYGYWICLVIVLNCWIVERCRKIWSLLVLLERFFWFVILWFIKYLVIFGI